MSSPPPNTWQDRRGMFQAGRAVHEPGKITGGSSVVDAVRRASVSSTTGDTMKPPAEPGTTTGRRRSSGVPFENLTNLKRGSQDYGERRTSHSEMQGTSGLVSGWFNRTFRGMTGPASAAGAPTEQQQPKQESRRGVMEWLEARTDSV